jgi:tetratricopeptide (TPR) repeat protein
MAATAESVCKNADLQDHGLLLADVYSVYGALYVELNRMELATEQFDKATAIREEAVVLGALEADHPNRANSYMNAGVSHTTSNTRKAIELHQQALKIRHSSDRFTHIQASGISLNYLNIGRCWLIVGELQKACEALETCLNDIRLHEAATNTQWPL